MRDGSLIQALARTDVVDNMSGWFDIRQAIQAYQRANGEMLVLAEEDARAKNLLYRFTP